MKIKPEFKVRPSRLRPLTSLVQSKAGWRRRPMRQAHAVAADTVDPAVLLDVKIAIDYVLWTVAQRERQALDLILGGAPYEDVARVMQVSEKWIIQLEARWRRRIWKVYREGPPISTNVKFRQEMQKFRHVYRPTHDRHAQYVIATLAAKKCKNLEVSVLQNPEVVTGDRILWVVTGRYMGVAFRAGSFQPLHTCGQGFRIADTVDAFLDYVIHPGKEGA